MRRFIPSMLVAAATLVVLILVWQLRTALILFVLSLMVAASLRAPVNFFAKRGMPHGLAVSLIHLLALIVLTGLFLIVLGPGLNELQQATDSFDRMYRQMTANWPRGTPFQQMVGEQLPPPQDLYNAIAGDQGSQLLQNFLGAASNVVDSITKFAIIFVLSIYWSLGRQNFEWQWISLLPVNQRRRARETWHELEEGVGGYVRSEIFQSVIAGVLLGVGYFLMGLKFPVLIALTGALLWLIPWLGAGLAMVLPMLAGLSIGTGLAIAAPLFTVIVLVFLELVVEPRLFTRRHYSPLLVVILMVAMAQAYGLMGLLLAPPLAAAIQTIFSSLTRAAPSTGQQDLAKQLQSLRDRLTGMQEQVTIKGGEQPSPEVVNLLGRLSIIMEQADQYFTAGEQSASQR